MKIEFNDKGSVATVMLTSTVLEYRRHNKAVDAALFLAPGTIAKSSGVFFMKSVISGKSRDVLRAYKVVMRELK